ncbi:Aminopeptidase N [Channa argus]|uniref:Aminopeptidase n=1 Tax=Channa argus TaxID=215402 RepID=A0A6G1PGF6_CHAAH|nr:Aminopeptidase N [Channa argus]
MGKSCEVSRLCVLFTVVAVISVATIVTLWTLALIGGDDDIASWDSFRLPTALVPRYYNITLWPHLSKDSNGLYIFTGNSTVEFECVKETDLILIHSNKLNYTELDNAHIARLTASGDGTAPSIRSSWLQPKTQYLVIQLNSKLSNGQKYQLYTQFTGELADDLAGFYRKVVNTTINGVAVTQTTFEPTKKMSTYLLAIIVSDYSHLSAQQGNILIRIWARRAAIEQGQGNYAINVTGPILEFFQLYYNISYPLSKSDFYFGAMENWGLVTYRETKLLYDPVMSSIKNKETTATIIAHELAHMWFGNLVTLRWWNEVWLNEGFASYVSYLGADHAEPAWSVKDLIVLEIHRVLAVDALASSHALSSKEDSIFLPEQIVEQFDVISYSKKYLNLFAYSNTVGNNLWQQLQMAVEANNVALPHPVSDIMNTWVLQMGFPVVTIDTSTGKVSQKHFLLDAESNITLESPYNYEWLIPVRWMKSGEVQRDVWWLTEKEVVKLEMRTGSSWVLANVNLTGYYRVNYDLGNWERLLSQLNSEHQVIPVINRAQLVDDAFNLARAQLVSTTLALRTTSYLLRETEYIPWQTALDNLHYYYLMLDCTEVYQPMQDYMKKLVTPLFMHFKNVTSNWTVIPDTLNDQYNEVNAIRMACSTGEAECQTLTTTQFQQWMDNPQHNLYLSYTLEPAMIRKQDATSVITSVASNRVGQRLAWDFVKTNWKYMFTQGLTAFKITVRISVKLIICRYGVGSFSFASMISAVTARFSTPAELQQLEEFEKEHSAAGFGSATLAVQQALERTKANIKWLQQNKQEILDWFNSQSV